MKFRKFSIIYLCINIFFLIPSFIIYTKLINFIMFPIVSSIINFIFVFSNIYGTFFMTFFHIIFFLILFFINLSIKIKKSNTSFYLIYTFLFIVDIILNIICHKCIIITINQ